LYAIAIVSAGSRELTRNCVTIFGSASTELQFVQEEIVHKTLAFVESRLCQDMAHADLELKTLTSSCALCVKTVLPNVEVESIVVPPSLFHDTGRGIGG